MATDAGFCPSSTYKTENDGFSSVSAQNPALITLHWEYFTRSV